MKNFRIELTDEQHRELKMIAAKLEVSLKELFLQGARELNSSPETHSSAKTEQIIKELKDDKKVNDKS